MAAVMWLGASRLTGASAAALPEGLKQETMFGDLLGDAVSSIIGDAFVSWLIPSRLKHEPLPPEGQWNASLGSIAAFLGGLAVLFVIVPTVAVVQGRLDENIPLLIMLTIGLVMSLMASASTRRAFRVASRRHALALVGVWCSRAVFIVGIVAGGDLLIRILSGAQ